MPVIIDNTGTVLSAESCYLVPDDDEFTWDDMSDSEITEFGRRHGRLVLADSAALDAVAALLSAEQWSSDHISAVADMVRATGRTIADV